jgi:hypothetical protein
MNSYSLRSLCQGDPAASDTVYMTVFQEFRLYLAEELELLVSLTWNAHQADT